MKSNSPVDPRISNSVVKLSGESVDFNRQMKLVMESMYAVEQKQKSKVNDREIVT